jgi:acyl dehydratase
LRFGEVKAGDRLPPLVVRISPTIIIAGALASQDFQDVHHDYQMIRRRGHPDIFMNMMTTSGMVGRYVTDWSGPNALVRAHELRLGRPNYAGDTMRMTGSVRSTEIVDGRGMVVVDVVGANSLGNHTESSVTLELAPSA